MGNRGGDQPGTDGAPSAGAPSAPDLLVVVLGGYWVESTSPVPSAAIVAALTDLGVTETSTRAALRRMTQAGGLETERHGRQTFYRFTPERSRWAMGRGRLLFTFGATSPEWDGRWTCVAFTLAEEGVRTGPVVRTGLRRLGLAQLYDGFWVSPRDVREPVAALLAEVDAPGWTILRADDPGPPAGGAGRRHPVDAWDLDGLRARYDAFGRELDRVGRRLDQGSLHPAAALAARTNLTVAWRDFAYRDPRLPAELLPEDWPLPALRDRFIEVHDVLGPPAEARLRTLTEPFGLEAGAQPRHRTAADTIRRGARS